MYCKIEPSGCTERKGMVQIRLAMYLEPDDYGYEKHNVQVSDKQNKTIWQNNPFHNHFIYVNPDTSDAEINKIARAFLYEAYIKWELNLSMDLKNNVLPFKRPAVITQDIKTACHNRTMQIKTLTTEWR